MSSNEQQTYLKFQISFLYNLETLQYHESKYILGNEGKRGSIQQQQQKKPNSRNKIPNNSADLSKTDRNRENQTNSSRNFKKISDSIKQYHQTSPDRYEETIFLIFLSFFSIFLLCFSFLCVCVCSFFCFSFSVFPFYPLFLSLFFLSQYISFSLSISPNTPSYTTYFPSSSLLPGPLFPF